LILYFENIKREQSGIYECYLKNSSISLFKRVEIIVKCNKNNLFLI